MNRSSTTLAAIVLSFAAAGSAFADGDVYSGPQGAAPASTLTRAQVQAQAKGQGVVTEEQLNQSPTVSSTRSRADVRAETLQAIARHELAGNDIELTLRRL